MYKYSWPIIYELLQDGRVIADIFDSGYPNFIK